MEIATVTQADIMEAFQQRVIRNFNSHFNATNCYIDDEPLPGGNEDPGWDHACSISMPDGYFDESLQVGGSRCLIQETSEVHVCVMQRHGDGDPETLDTELIRDSQKSMVRFYKPRILSAILVEQTGTAKLPWIPLDENGRSLLVNGIYVSRTVGPRRHSHWPLLYLTAAFKVTWNWNL